MAKLTDRELELIRSSISDRTKTPDDVLLATLRAVLSGGMQNVDPELIRVFTDEINARGITADMLGESQRRKSLRITESKLRRILRNVITEMRREEEWDDPIYGEYGSGTEFSGNVVLELYKEEWPDLDVMEFEDFCRDIGHCRIDNEFDAAKGHILTISGSFDALWNGWVNCCSDDPHEFMDHVIKGQENCPDLP